jgi:hypothetical protein
MLELKGLLAWRLYSANIRRPGLTEANERSGSGRLPTICDDSGQRAAVDELPVVAS